MSLNSYSTGIFGTQATLPLSGWLNRSLPISDPHSFHPVRSDLRFVALRNAPVEPDGFTLAMFKHSEDAGETSTGWMAVTSTGDIRLVSTDDTTTFTSYIDRLPSLPSPDTFRHTWRIAQPRTSQPIDRLLWPLHLPLPETPRERYEQEYGEASVSGFDKENSQLSQPVDGLTQLPELLSELMGAVLEARQSGNKDNVVLQRVREILGPVF